MLRHLCFQRTKPVGICGLVCSEQAIALTHRGIVSGRMPRMCRLEGEDRIAFRYRDNPNGSTAAIAGVLGEARNVLGLMPHPERAIEPLLGGSDGRRLFESLLGALR